MVDAIFLGALAGVVVLCTVVWAVRHCHDGAGSADAGGGGGGGVSSGTGKQEALLNQSKDDVVAVAVAVVPHQPGGGGQRGPEPSDGDVDLCEICKARLADAGWGRCRCRGLRPCGHVYHADCISLWLQRKWICPVCRSAVAMSRPEILDAIV